MQLNLYMKRAGLTTGPLLKNTSHSRLEVLKKYLLSQPQFSGKEDFLHFGNALHEQWLCNKCSYQLSKEETKKLAVMLSKLKAHVVAISLLSGAVVEQKVYGSLNGVEIALILDIEQKGKNRGADLKTTTCSTYEDFVDSCKKYGYFRQGKTYKIARRLKHFFFIAIQKTTPHNIFILDVSDFPDEEKYAERELEFLLYFYKHYGNFIGVQQTITNGETVAPLQSAEKITKVKIMAKTGKEVLSEIAEALKEHKTNKKELIRIEKNVQRSRARIEKLVSKFPKNETALYSEKIERVNQLL